MSQALSPRESINRHFNGHRPSLANRYYQLKAAKAQAVTEESRAAIQSQMEALAAEDEAIPKKNPHRKRVGLLMAADALTEATTRYREAIARRANLHRNPYNFSSTRALRASMRREAKNRSYIPDAKREARARLHEVRVLKDILWVHQEAHDQGLHRIKLTFLDAPRHHQEAVIVRHVPKDRMVVRYLGANPAEGQNIQTLRWDAATESYKSRTHRTPAVLFCS